MSHSERTARTVEAGGGGGAHSIPDILLAAWIGLEMFGWKHRSTSSKALQGHKNDVVGRLWAASLEFDTCALDHDMYLTLMKDRIPTCHNNM